MSIEIQESRQKRFPMVSVVISCFNSKGTIRQCLQALKNLTYPNFEVIVVDCASTDGSDAIIEREFPDVKLIKTNRMGIGEAINVGISKAKGDLIVFDLNSDDIVSPNWLSSLVKVLTSSPKVGVVCGKRLIYGTKDTIDSAGGKIDFLIGRAQPIGQRRKDSSRYNTQKEVDFVCVIMTKREVLERIGLCDEKYYLLYEDTDFCFRAKKAGYKVIYMPDSVFWHYGSFTMGRRNPRVHYYGRRNAIRFVLKNFPLLIMFMPLFFHVVLLTIYYILHFLLKKQFTNLVAEKNALLWNLKNLKETVKSRKQVDR